MTCAKLILAPVQPPDPPPKSKRVVICNACGATGKCEHSEGWMITQCVYCGGNGWTLKKERSQ